ncbi:uncharacterized protein MELLADRAFT_58326 [Melampsora larici-populina 98AG31]|uniref:Uncharacterized protein n=1 Tax=Melampsora larici-populina (strain 98AG31 / pathotype 3-4-7) TaxID=747676 RepID=F4R342_MELLP|nr:uncharacterized protein MELLADRAFT_58326 [Melampsora larici-populina 98AG31]EGG13233.1 hypothetical protein MELLADRAFT_58326 [Melampsora larici-populina 98AG31]
MAPVDQLEAKSENTLTADIIDGGALAHPDETKVERYTVTSLASLHREIQSANPEYHTKMMDQVTHIEDEVAQTRNMSSAELAGRKLYLGVETDRQSWSVKFDLQYDEEIKQATALDSRNHKIDKIIKPEGLKTVKLSRNSRQDNSSVRFE